MPTNDDLEAVPGSLAATLCTACMRSAGAAGTGDLAGYQIAVGDGDWWYSDRADCCDVCDAPDRELFQGWLVPR